MGRRTLIAVFMIGLVTAPLTGGLVGAQVPPEPPGEPGAGACAFPAALGILFTSCSSGTHRYSELISHSPTGSVYSGLDSSFAPVKSRIQVEDTSHPLGWRTVHTVTCGSFEETAAYPADPEACAETGTLPDPGTLVRHVCTTNRAVVGLVACTITYLQ